MRRIRPSARRIDASLFDAVQYLSVLHAGGAYQHEAVISLAKYSAYFGPAAEEFSFVVSAMNSGLCLYDALHEMGRTTRSSRLRQFVQGYAASVRVTGSAVSYLSSEVSRMREERRIAQTKYLESLAVFAEIYLTLFVAAPLFAVIAGLVLGILSGSGIQYLLLTVYLFLPFGTAAYLILLDSMKETVHVRNRNISTAASPVSCSADERMARLRKYDRRLRLRKFIRHPFVYFIRHPDSIYLFSMPAGIVLSLPFTESPYLWTGVFLLTVFVPFAVFHTLNSRYRRISDAALPVFCSRISDTVQQGLPLASAIHFAADEDISSLKADFRRLSADIRFGDTVTSALFSFASRIQLLSADKMVIYLTEVSRFSPDASFALNALVNDASASLLADEERRQGMSLYSVVMYLGWFVFLFVAVILLTVFLDIFSSASGTLLVSAETYASLIIQAVLIHGICTGLTAGKISEGSVFAGVKHACVLFGLGTLVFLLLSAYGIVTLPSLP